MHWTTRPLQWSGPRTSADDQKRSPFEASWPSTLTLLDHELRQLRAEAVVLQIDVREQDIRLDGQIRASARPDSSAVRLLFDTPQGQLSFQCDQFTDWKGNTRAIALGLQALRRVERYGIASSHEQYKGYLAIGPGDDGELPGDRVTAIEILEEWSGLRLGLDDPPYVWGRAWRVARAEAHPDRRDGDRAGWDEIERAARVLGLGDVS